MTTTGLPMAVAKGEDIPILCLEGTEIYSASLDIFVLILSVTTCTCIDCE